mmetsp:Transcript_16500/g.62754  ORF Transcript_16500/g.62754 Transcript_16500/m.62754 type:complete len:247 (-) Transcript_16500:61-801(-)
MLAHIRKATCGAQVLENVHPFQRELWGRPWTFAHNGDLPFCRASATADDRDAVEHPGERATYMPIGDTDSEIAFCMLLNRLQARFETMPSKAELYDEVLAWATALTREDESEEVLAAGEGIAEEDMADAVVPSDGNEESVEVASDSPILNFLLSNGEILVAGCWPGRRPGSKVFNGLWYLIRESPFATAKLVDVDLEIDFASCTTPTDRVAVIATVPITGNENWTRMRRGDLLFFEDGQVHRREDL